MAINPGDTYLKISVSFDEESDQARSGISPGKIWENPSASSFLFYYQGKAILDVFDYSPQAVWFWGYAGVTKQTYDAAGNASYTVARLTPTIVGLVSGSDVAKLQNTVDRGPINRGGYEYGSDGKTKTVAYTDDYVGADPVKVTVQSVSFPFPFDGSYYSTVYIDVSGGPLFSPYQNNVNFNALTSSQVDTLKQDASQNIYNGQAGDDTVRLPSVASAKNLGGTGVSYDLNHAFTLGDGTDTLYGSPDGPTNVSLGAGIDTLYMGAGSVSASFQSGQGTLRLVFQGSNPASLTVTNVAMGNVIDLVGSSANQTLFDPVANTVDLYNVVYGKNQATKLGSVHLTGDFSGKTFALADDGAGGRLLKAEESPSDLVLAQLCAATYGSVIPNGYEYVTSRTWRGGLFDSGLLVEEFRKDDTIVVAVRGTDTGSYYNLVKNLLTDTSFAAYFASRRLSGYVNAVSDFLAEIRQKDPYANIVLTGHSLGGAVADLVGQASHYRTVTFNPPGSGDLVGSLKGALASARNAATAAALDGGVRNVRVAGDQVSQVGTPIGTTQTLASPYVASWSNFLKNHSVDTFVSRFTAGVKPTDGKEAALPYVRNGLSVLGPVSTVINFVIDVAEAHSLIPIDPPAASIYTFSGNPGSPALESITLPYLDGVSSYEVAVEYGGTWSGSTTVLPGIPYTPGSTFEAVRFSPLDGNSASISAVGSFVFDAQFASAGTFSGQLTFPTAPAASHHAIRADLDGDGYGDLVWQNANGAPSAWTMQGRWPEGAAVGTYLNYDNPGASWRLVGTGDLNADGQADLVWQNSDGLPSGWLVGAGGSSVAGYPVFSNPGQDWRLVGTGDLNGDRRDDLLWQNSDGLPSGWIMGPDGTTVVRYPVFQNPGADWRLVGAADLNGDGRDDLLWQRSDGLPSAWLINQDGTGVQGYPVFQNPGAFWRLVGGADLNGDGRDDLLWQNGAGLPSAWLMDETGTGVAGYPVFENPGASWTLKGAADANGDGRADLVWQDASGLPSLWIMGAGGSSVDAYPVLDNPGASWHVV